jgi:hypothetical protein
LIGLDCNMGFISFDATVGSNHRAVGHDLPPGQDLAEELLRRVEALGYSIVERVTQHEGYGWSFTVKTDDSQPIWCMLQLSDEWLLITHRHLPLLRKLFGAPALSAGHAKFDSALVGLLASLPFVSNVRWFRTHDDLRHGRTGQP